jgi:hypothetical protein
MKRQQLSQEKRKIQKEYMFGISSNTLFFSNILTKFLQKYFNFFEFAGIR